MEVNITKSHSWKLVSSSSRDDWESTVHSLNHCWLLNPRNTSTSITLSQQYWKTDCSVLFLNHPRSEGWPHRGRTFSIYLYCLSFWLTLPQRVLSTTLFCLSRPCVVFLACLHLALFLALFLSPGNSHGVTMLASLLWQCLAVPCLLQLCWEPTHLFSLLSTTRTESFSVLSSQRPQDMFVHSSWVSSFYSCTWLQAILALSLVLSALKSVCCDF